MHVDHEKLGLKSSQASEPVMQSLIYFQKVHSLMSGLGRKPTVDLQHNLAYSLFDWTVAYRLRAAIQYGIQTMIGCYP